MPDNPSQELVEHCRDKDLLPQGTRFELLDVTYASVPGAVEALLGSDPPDALVLTGYSHRAEGLTLESRADDRRDPEKPDAAGLCPSPHEVGAGAELLHRGDLPALAARLRAEGLPAAVSVDAGAYLCNLSYHTALSRIERDGLPTSALFLHLPAIAGTPLAQTSAASMALADMARGLALIAETLAGQGAARR